MPFPSQRFDFIARILITVGALFLINVSYARAALPRLINKTKSLSVVSVAERRASPEFPKDHYVLRLRNDSSIPVFGLIVSVLGRNGVCDLHTPRSFWPPLISANGMNDLRLDVPGNEAAWAGPGGEGCSAKPKPGPKPTVAIDAVDFVNGTYEGDPSKAAIMECIRLGEVSERQRIVALVTRDLDSGQPDSQKLAAITSEIHATERAPIPVPSLVRSAMKRFPFAHKNAVEQGLYEGAQDQNVLFLSNLKIYSLEFSNGHLRGTTLNEWWKSPGGECDLLSPQGCPNRN